jgi:phenylalanyl-tRNA synthetase alpha chain
MTQISHCPFSGASEREALSELHSLERRILQAIRNGDKSFRELEGGQGLDGASISRAANWLSARGYVTISEKRTRLIRLGANGKKFMASGLPERRLYEVLPPKGKTNLNDAHANSGLAQDEFTPAVGWARRKGWINIKREGDKTLIARAAQPVLKSPDEQLLELLRTGPIDPDQLKPDLKTGLALLMERPDAVETDEVVDRAVGLTEAGRTLAAQVEGLREEVNQLTPQLLASAKWRDVEFRPYDVQAPVARVWPGKKQPFLGYLDMVKSRLVAMGFKEMTGPSVELMFFNCDALYMPQDHPAREIHDIYYIKEPSHGDLSKYDAEVKNVEATHENGWTTGSTGWNSQFSTEESHRLILRSQGTAISARMLVNKRLEIPGKYFSVARVYRPDVVDRTHLTEFHHLEGIIVGEELTFRNLLGTLETFAREVAGAEKVRFRPDYFPFTEPSVELSAYSEELGWIEFGGAGMFRPEVTQPLGIGVQVIAWGLGVNRMFMMRNNISDIRQLFSQDLDWLREQKVT